jgi:tetratricopeptide (TPR) repeat protein
MATQKYFNWKLAFVIGLGLVVLAVTAYGIRNWRRRHLAGQGLVKGTQAFEQSQWEQAAKHLGQYRLRVPDDIPILFKYAEAHLNIRPLKQDNINQALIAYRDILHYDKNNHKAAVSLVELYLQMNLPGEARLIAEQTLKEMDNPELRTLLAVAQINLKNYNEAYVLLQNVIREHPDQISAYKNASCLVKRQPEIAPESNEEFWLNEAVKNNSESSDAYCLRAEYYARNNLPKLANEDLDKAQTLKASDPSVCLRLALVLIWMDRLEEAKVHLEQIQKEIPQNVMLWHTWAEWACKMQDKKLITQVAEEGIKVLGYKKLDFMSTAIDLFIQADRLDRALEGITHMRQQDLNSALLEFYEGLIAGKQENPYKAVAHFRNALALAQSKPAETQADQEITKYRLVLANALHDSGEWLTAVQQLQTVVAENPNDLDARLSLARILLAGGDWKNAVQQTLTIREQHPENYDAMFLCLRAQIYRLLQRPNTPDDAVLQKIESDLDTLEKAIPDNVEIGLLRVQRAFLQRKFTDAEILLTKLKQQNPSHLKLSMLEVNALILQNNFSQAKERLQQIIAEFPRAVTPVRVLSTLMQKNKQYGEAETMIKQALQRNTSPKIMQELAFLLVELYERQNQSDQICHLLNSFAQKQPLNIQLKQRLLRCKEVRTNTKQAQKLIDQMKTIEGDKSRRWRCEQVKIWLDDENFAEKYNQNAISLLKEILTAYPEDLNAGMLLATSYERAGKLSLAVKTYQQAYERDPDNIAVIIPTVAALNRARQYDQAKEIINRTSQFDWSSPAFARLELQNDLVQKQWGNGVSFLEDLLAQDQENCLIYLMLLADLKMKNKQWDQAETYLRKARNEKPDSILATSALVDLYLRQKHNDTAMQVCHALVDSLQNAPAYLLRARAHARLNKPALARKDISQAQALAPENPGVFSAKSDFHRARGQEDEAVEAIRKALSLMPDNVRIQIQAISLFLASKDTRIQNEGVGLLENSIQKYPHNPQLSLMKIRLLLAAATRPNLENAIEILKKITLKNPEITEAWILLGSIALQQGQPMKTMDYVRQGRCWGSSPHQRKLLFLKADAEKEINPDDAINTLLNLRKLYPKDIRIVLNLADIYILAEQADKAVQLLQTVLPSCQSNDQNNVRIALAAAQYENGAQAKALQGLEDLFNADPENPTPLITQAWLLARNKQWDTIQKKFPLWIQAYSKGNDLLNRIAADMASMQDPEAKNTARKILLFVMEKDPQNIPAIQALAIMLQENNEIDQAASLYDKVLQLAPENIVALNNYAWILCEEKKNYQKALELANRGLAKAPNHLDMIDTRGMIYYRLGQYQHAAQDFQTCIDLYPPMTPNLTGSHFHLALTLVQLGDKKQALLHADRALRLQKKIRGLNIQNMQELQQLRQSLTQGE